MNAGGGDVEGACGVTWQRLVAHDHKERKKSKEENPRESVAAKRPASSAFVVEPWRNAARLCLGTWMRVTYVRRLLAWAALLVAASASTAAGQSARPQSSADTSAAARTDRVFAQWD